MSIPALFELFPQIIPKKGVVHVGMKFWQEHQTLYQQLGLKDEQILWLDRIRYPTVTDALAFEEADLSHHDRHGITLSSLYAKRRLNRTSFDFLNLQTDDNVLHILKNSAELLPSIRVILCKIHQLKGEVLVQSLDAFLWPMGIKRIFTQMTSLETGGAVFYRFYD